MRTPVKLPGPSVVATSRSSEKSTLASRMISSTIGISASA
jgi:hypothetical protein